MENHQVPHLHCHDAAAHWERLEKRMQKAWRFSDQVLDAARPALRKRMLEMDAKLTKSAVFAAMLPLDSCDFLWVLFLMSGEPGGDEWQKTWGEESALRLLKLRDVYVVVASIELEVAECALLKHAQLAGKGDDKDIDVAMQSLEAATSCLFSAEKALDLAEDQIPHGAPSRLH